MTLNKLKQRGAGWRLNQLSLSEEVISKALELQSNGKKVSDIARWLRVPYGSLKLNVRKRQRAMEASHENENDRTSTCESRGKAEGCSR